VRGSLCLGAYDATGAQIGLARFISDFATYCYICDVYVLDGHRGRGLATAMLAMAKEHPRLQGLRRWNLVTRDAHPLYAPLGFTPIAHPDRYMERLIPNVYLRPDDENE
jgi:GNAT superfamily N-acetyltransferase